MLYQIIDKIPELETTGTPSQEIEEIKEASAKEILFIINYNKDLPLSIFNYLKKIVIQKLEHVVNDAFADPTVSSLTDFSSHSDSDEQEGSDDREEEKKIEEVKEEQKITRQQPTPPPVHPKKQNRKKWKKRKHRPLKNFAQDLGRSVQELRKPVKELTQQLDKNLKPFDLLLGIGKKTLIKPQKIDFKQMIDLTKLKEIDLTKLKEIDPELRHRFLSLFNHKRHERRHKVKTNPKEKRELEQFQTWL